MSYQIRVIFGLSTHWPLSQYLSFTLPIEISPLFSYIESLLDYIVVAYLCNGDKFISCLIRALSIIDMSVF